MRFWGRIFGGATATRIEPTFRAATMGDPIAFSDLSDPALADYLRTGTKSASGGAVGEHTAMMIGVANRCVNIISGIIATTPSDLMLRADEKSRLPAVGDPFRDVLTVKPNRWQTPAELKRMLQAHVLLRGNGYAFKVRSRGYVRELIPLIPSRMRPVQNSDLSITYNYTTASGSQVSYSQAEIFHLRGLSLDGVVGLSVLTYAREAFGLSRATERAAANLYRNGQFTSGFLTSPNKLSDEAYGRLKADMEVKRGAYADEAAGVTLLEEGLKFEANSLTAKDAEFLGTRGFQRGDVGMFFGVPPHLYGDVSNSTSWGTGIEQQNIGFLQYTMQPHFTMWSETYKRDCLAEPKSDPKLYVHFDLNGLLRGDSGAQSTYFARALGLGGGVPWMTQNEVRGKSDLEPRKEPWADELPKHGLAIETQSQVLEPADPAKVKP